MAERKPFLLRIDRAVLDAVQRWANDDLRSLNGQIEFILRDALRRAGRSRPPERSDRSDRSVSGTDVSPDVSPDVSTDPVSDGDPDTPDRTTP
jgi:hypothetical protein